MAIRNRLNVDHYKATPAKPVFLKSDPTFVTKRDPLAIWLDRFVWAAFIAALFIAGYVAASVVLGLL